MEKLVVGITGSRGYIGSHLTQFLSQDTDFQLAPFKGDLLNDEDLDLYFQNNLDITHLVHLAGIAEARESLKKLFDVNVSGTANLLKFALKNNVNPKIIFASTYAVYGEPQNGVESFETDDLATDSHYGLSKKFAEDLVRFHSQNHLIARLPSVYGGVGGKGVISKFLNAIKAHGEIVLNGDGSQIRNFLHVDDVCVFFSIALKSSNTGTFNVSDGKRVSLADVIEKLKTKYLFEVKYLPANNPSKNLSQNPDKLISAFKFNFKHTDLAI